MCCRSDWVGLDGMVTQKNPDENVNHLPSVTIHSEPDNLTIISNNADSRFRCIVFFFVLHVDCLLLNKLHLLYYVFVFK